MHRRSTASGIGVDTARALAKAGAAVALAVRNLDAGKVVAQRITHATANQKVFVRSLDLADQRSIATFVAGWKGPLHILVNNAGILCRRFPPLDRSLQVYESIETAISRLRAEESLESETQSEIQNITRLGQAILSREWQRVKIGT